MPYQVPDDVRRAEFIHACLSTGIPPVDGEAMLAAHDARSRRPDGGPSNAAGYVGRAVEPEPGTDQGGCDG